MAPTDPHQGGDLFDMAKDGTSIPNDAGKQNLIKSVPRPDQVTDSNDIGVDSLATAADNPTDIPRVCYSVTLTSDLCLYRLHCRTVRYASEAFANPSPST